MIAAALVITGTVLLCAICYAVGREHGYSRAMRRVRQRRKVLGYE